MDNYKYENPLSKLTNKEIIQAFPEGKDILTSNKQLLEDEIEEIKSEAQDKVEKMKSLGYSVEKVDDALDLFFLVKDFESKLVNYNWICNFLERLDDHKTQKNYKEVFSQKVQRVKQIPIQLIAEREGIVPKKGMCICPFHSEKTPSFKLYEKTNTFYCFGCGIKGDVIKFYMSLYNLDFKQAVNALHNI